MWGLLAEQALVLCACSERASELYIHNKYYYIYIYRDGIAHAS